ncbi:MAG: tetratricopeptide repeat protein, partial [Bacteroidota bacterium]
MKQLLIFVLTLFLGIPLLAQKKGMNGILRHSHLAKDDTLSLCIRKGQQLFNQYPDSARTLAMKAVAESQRRSDVQSEGLAMVVLGLSERALGNINSAMQAYNNSLQLFRQWGDSLLVAESMMSIGRTHQALGDYPAALEYQIECQKLLVANDAPKGILARSYGSIGNVYRLSKDYEKAEDFFKKALTIRLAIKDQINIGFSYNSLGLLYNDLKKYKQAFDYYEKALQVFQKNGNRQFIEVTYRNMGNTHTEMGNFEQARSFFEKALQIAAQMNSKEKMVRLNYRLGVLHEKQQRIEEAIDYFNKSLNISQDIGKTISIQDAYLRLSNCHAQLNDYQSAFEAYRGYIDNRDILFNEKSDQTLAKLKTQYETREKEQAILLLNKQRQYLLIGIGIFAVLTLLLLRTSQLRRRANRQLQQSQKETEQALREKEQVLQKLQSTHTQLVQAEKMASLGQLTAGIAHEINNPINFIVSNVKALRLNFEDMSELLQQIVNWPQQPKEEQVQQLLQAAQELDLPFISEEVTQLIGGIERGADRTVRIIEGLKTFSHSKGDTFELADVHKGLDSTLVILDSRLGSDIQIHKSYKELPLIECQLGKLNQVFMNI